MILRSSRRPALAALVLVLASQLARAQAIVTPRTSVLLSGQSCVFQALVLAGPAPDQSQPDGGPPWAWTLLEGGLGALDASTGRYTAPELAEPRIMTLQASCGLGPGLSAQALVLVLPREPFALVAEVQGPGWLEPFSWNLPFLDQADRRSLAQSQVGRPSPSSLSSLHSLPVQDAAYGLPCTLAWAPVPRAQAQLLSYEEGHELVRKDVTGQHSQVITATGGLRRFRVEALRRVPGGADRWESVRQEGLIHLRGLVPFAGQVLLEPGHADGSRLAARFQAPFGLALVTARSAGHRLESLCLVSDPGSHVIRQVSMEGEVSTPWGRPGQAGHRDVDGFLARAGPGEVPADQASLFRGHTFLLSAGTFRDRYLSRAWQCLVADSGNHCLRLLETDGAVTTLAGQPGRAGYRDAVLGDWALFSNPQGLAEDAEGNVYVADQGNCVIRKLLPSGQVETLAGTPGQPGHVDGPARTARFSELRGLAVSHSSFEPEALFAVDGHAIRRISLADGEVSTPVGVVDTPGFREIPASLGGERLEALRQPCLNQPCGLTASYHGLNIVDQGNHSVRHWCFASDTLTTTVGDPGLDQTRWGLVRDGLQVPLDERYAALASPTTLVSSHRYPDTLLIANGCCLAELFADQDLQDRLEIHDLDWADASLDQACRVHFSVAARNRAHALSARPFHYTVDFLEADGSLAARERGTGTTPAMVNAQGLFARRGSGTVVVRCVSNQGVSAGTQAELEVR